MYADYSGADEAVLIGANVTTWIRGSSRLEAHHKILLLHSDNGTLIQQYYLSMRPTMKRTTFVDIRYQCESKSIFNGFATASNEIGADRGQYHILVSADYGPTASPEVLPLMILMQCTM